MDRRYRDFKALTPPQPFDDGAAQREADRLAQIMQEGITGDFWLVLKDKIDLLILDAEKRFVDGLAPTYEAYVQLWGRRQSLITVLAMPHNLIEAPTPTMGMASSTTTFAQTPSTLTGPIVRI